MALRCLLFSSDDATAEPICQVLADLGVEGDYCSEGVAAVERVTNQQFQLVIIDWDTQPEAGLLLTAARERKANERPLTLAIVSDDVSVPKALQAGANSILRKPILINQVKDTLTTARDLLRAKESSATAAQAAAAGASAGATSLPAGMGNEKTLRAGEFLQSSTPAPGGQFETETDVQGESGEVVDPLKDLEPVAASVAQQTPAPLPPPPPPPDEPRGLEWYLKTRSGSLPPAPAYPHHPPAPEKPELLGFDQSPSPAPTPVKSEDVSQESSRESEHAEQEKKAEEKLFAYIAGEDDQSEERAKPSFRLGKGTILTALVLAACAIVAAPQAPWHPQVRATWARGQRALHAWLNPQPVTTPPAPESHESFGRPGDEYKMPVAENIPDATTDPSQIQVVPVVDPTAKKPNNNGANPEQNTAPTDAPATAPNDQPVQPAGVQGQENQPAQSVPDSAQPAGGSASPAGSPTTAPATVEPPRDEAPVVTTPAPVATQPAPPKNTPPREASMPAHVPSSLKSQMVSMTPDAGGNKPVEAALPSIEPVVVPEAAERNLLADQPAIAYPANAKGQQGTVVLQVLIGRDGTVQDAKFLQGSLAFARAAIDGVKEWKFKPYAMNGRPVSVQTTMTMSFKPGQ
jgi:TonB family protein